MPDEEITRELVIPSQNELQVTTALTGITPDIERCNICTANVRVALHHIVFRSRGGKSGPVLPLCAQCHIFLHEGAWALYADADGLELEDEETGEIIWRLKRPPEDLEAGRVVQALDNVTELQKRMPEIAPSLTPTMAQEVLRAIKQLGAQGWRATARLVYEMHRYRTPGLSASEKIDAIGQFFDLRRSQIYNLLQIVEELGDNPRFDDTPLPMEILLEVSRTTEPDAWLELAEERKIAHPKFSRTDLRRETERAGALKVKPEGSGGEEQPQRVWAKCGKCGAVDWMEKQPVGSDGQPVNIEEYRT